MTKDAKETRKLKRGVALLSGERQPKTKYDFECLDLVAQRYGMDRQDAISFALFMSSMNAAYDDNDDNDDND